MMTLDVTLDLSRAREKAMLAQTSIDPAAARAANRTITTVRAEAIPLLRKDYPDIKAGELRARMKLTQATRNTLVAKVTFSGRRVNLYGRFGMRSAKGRFGVQFGKLPWRVEDLQGEVVPPELLTRAFRNRLPGGRATVFSRLGKRRYPIAVLVVPGIAKDVVNKRLEAIFATIGRARFREAFAQEMRFAMSRGRS